MHPATPHSGFQARSRGALLATLAVVIILGLASRKFAAVLPNFLSANAGDALWTIAVFLSLAILAPGWSPLKLGLLAFAISICVELSQLLSFFWLDAIRKTLPGRLLLGTGFLWLDLLRYFAGALLAVVIDSWQRRRQRRHPVRLEIS